MGADLSKIDTSKIPVSEIKATGPVEQGRFCPPFRKYGEQAIQQKQKKLQTVVNVIQPVNETISVNEEYFADLEDAFDCKTKDIQLDTVLLDEQYYDLKTYIGKQGEKDVTLQLKYFSKFNTYAFNNILYEIHMNDEIKQLNCPNLFTFIDKYIIQTGLQAQGQQNPNTQVFVLPPSATNLSQIIRYRRQNNWAWTVSEFNALAGDLARGLTALHGANISHNDIRPCNVFYSLQKNVYGLACFGNSVKSNNKNNSNSNRNTTQVRTSIFFGAPQLSTSKDANLQQADIYSLGMTLLSAFYLCEPINREAVAQYNKKYESSGSAMTAIKQMIMPVEKRGNIGIIAARIPKGESSQRMQSFIQSLRYKNSPKDKKLIKVKKDISQGYQRLGLWNDWKDKQHQAYELQEGTLDDYKKANSLYDLSKIQSCRGDLQSANQYAKSSSKIYRNLGYSAYQSGNTNEALNFFTRAVECSKYFENKNDVDTAKNLQGLALAHAEKGDYQVSKPLIRQANSIVIKNGGRDSTDYCKVRMSQAKIECDYGQFEESQKILNECLTIAENKTKINQQLGLKLKAQVLQQLGRNCMLYSSYHPERQQELVTKGQKYIADSIAINETFPNNHIALATNIQTFGQLELRRQDFAAAKNNFQKAQQMRQAYASQGNNTHSTLQKQKAECFCSLGACENGLGNSEQSLRNYNQGLAIYRNLYGSDHNKYSAMAIGNMSKVYYKMNNKEAAKDCLKLATTILQDLLGNDDPDFLHFKSLQGTL